ncbi:MAG TPA: DUF5946 family protein [Acidobacteriaceae bacterium]|nr:DUF5946 family protein [Acidobacteriaceae bacterium]
MPSEQELFDELSFYTLAHGDPAFIHENAADAWRAQQANETTKPMAVVFAVMGLYLYIEKGFTGKQVQRAHMRMARGRRSWPQLALPTERGRITVADVVAAKPGMERDAMIRRWCEAVWETWQESRPQIMELARAELGVD